MHLKPRLEEISIRTELRSGDLGYIIFLHGLIYKQEYNYGIGFETYVAGGLAEFWNNYDAQRDGIWICEHKESIVGFMLLMHREAVAQLRYFILKPEYRGIGLGNKLMNLFLEFMIEHNYKSAYLWTTNELKEAAHLYTKYGFKLTEEKESTEFGKLVLEQRYDLNLL